MNHDPNLLNTCKAEVVLDVTSFFRTHILNTDSIVISEHDDIISEGLIDSMGIIRLLAHLQDLYGISDFDNTDLTLDNFRTIDRIALMITRYRSLQLQLQ